MNLFIYVYNDHDASEARARSCLLFANERCLQRGPYFVQRFCHRETTACLQRPLQRCSVVVGALLQVRQPRIASLQKCFTVIELVCNETTQHLCKSLCTGALLLQCSFVKKTSAHLCTGMFLLQRYIFVAELFCERDNIACLQ